MGCDGTCVDLASIGETISGIRKLIEVRIVKGEESEKTDEASDRGAD
jgi:hypothetical protein